MSSSRAVIALLFLAALPASAQTRDADRQQCLCNGQYITVSASTNCASFCGATTPAPSALTSTVPSTSISMQNSYMAIAQAGAGVAQALRAYFQQRREQRAREEQRRRDAVEEEEREQTRQFEKGQRETLAKMIGPKPTDATMKNITTYGREQDDMRSAATTAVRSRLDALLREFGLERTRASCDTSDCIDRCSAAAECVQRCATTPCASGATDAAATLASLGQVEPPEESDYFYDLQMRRTGASGSDVPPPNMLINHYATTWAGEPAVRLDPGAWKTMNAWLQGAELWLQQKAWDWGTGQAMTALTGRFAFVKNLKEANEAYTENAFRLLGSTRQLIAEAPAVLASGRDPSNLEQRQTAIVEKAESTFRETADEKFRSALGVKTPKEAVLAAAKETAKEFGPDYVREHYHFSMPENPLIPWVRTPDMSFDYASIITVGNESHPKWYIFEHRR
jgi:hypothetical protein